MSKNELIGPPNLRDMTHAQRVNVLKARGINVYYAESRGGGNRDHRLWWVEFSGMGLDGGHYRMQVQCNTYSWQYDGKAACERAARRNAVELMLGLVGTTHYEG